MVVTVGQQLGNYQLTRLLGRGGFADVYLGKHVHLDTFAAIKVLHTHLSQVDVEKFRNEARTIGRLTHPNIVRVLDYGVQGATPYLVMDFAPNGSLRQHHPKGLSVPLATIVHYVDQVAAALQFAHDEGLVHRDVKPENILVGRRNEILLSDFGIALVSQSSRHRSVKEMAGTITYMAPEQIHAKPQPASDQYALGVIVYEWLSGENPFHGSFFELASQHLLALPPPLYGRVHGVTSAIERVVLTALAKDPEQRFVSVKAFANAFKQACHYLLQRDPNAMPHLIKMLYDAPLAEVNTSERIEQQKIGISRRKLFVGGLAALAVLTGGATILGLTGKIPGVAFGSASTPTPASKVIQPPGTTLYTYRGHSDQVSAVKWSPDGTQIASGSFDTSVQVWDAMTGNNVLSYHGHTDKVCTVAWSLDGTRIASGGFDATVQVWDSTTSTQLFTYSGHSHAVRAVEWSTKPIGKYIASGSADNTVQVWDAGTRALVYTYRGHTNGVNTLVWSPDGTRIASAGVDNTVQVWKSSTGELLVTYTGHPKEIQSVAWSPDGTRVASASYDQTVQIWDANSGSRITTFTGHSDYVNAVTWSPDGRQIASASRDGTVRVWDPSTADIKIIYNKHSNQVVAVNWSPDGTRIASGGLDDTVQVWQAV